MIKHLLVIFFCCFFFANSSAQTYGNEWIDYTQKYYKIKIHREGIYRLDSITLAAAGVPVNGIDAHHFQIFNKGKEQAIYIEGESDGVLNANDFIEFYATKNDGELDKQLYVYTPALPNPYYSLVNDTSVYFLTWNTLFTNNRIVTENDTAFSSHPAAPYFLKNEVVENHYVYYNGETDVVGGTDSRYVRSETWGGPPFNLGNMYVYSLHTTNRFLAGPDAVLTTRVIGASKDDNLINSSKPDHHINIQCNNQVIADSLFFGYESNLFVKHLPVSTLTEGITDVYYRSVADPGFTSNRTFVTYLTISYPHTFNMEGKGFYAMGIVDQPGLKARLNFSNFNSSGAVYLYDLTNSKRIAVSKSGANYRALISNSGTEKKCILVSNDS